MSWLYHPWPVDEAAAAFVAEPVRVTLAPSRRGRPTSFLREPVVVNPFVAAALAEPTRVTLTRIRPVATGFRLPGPVVVGQPPVETTIRLTLARIRPVPVRSRLLAPTDTRGLEDQGRVRVTLVRIRPAPVQSLVREPVVVAGAVEVYGPRVTVAPSHLLSRRVHSRLAPPVVVEPFLARRTQITLARIRPVAVKARLAAPTDTTGLEDQGRIRVTLTRIRPVRTIALVRRPTVVTPPFVFVAEPVRVALTRIRPVRTMLALRPPIEVCEPPLLFYDDFDRVVASGWGTADSGQEWTPLIGAAGNFSVSGSRGDWTRTAAGGGTDQIGVPLGAQGNYEATGRFMFDAAPPSSSHSVSFYLASFPLTFDNYADNRVDMRVAGTFVANIVPAGAGDYGSWYRFRFRFTFDGGVYAKAWKEGAAEPDWMYFFPVPFDWTIERSFVVGFSRSYPTGTTSIGVDDLQVEWTVCPVPGGSIKGPAVRIRPPRTHSILRPPTVVDTGEDKIKVTLAPQRRGKPTSFLRPPETDFVCLHTSWVGAQALRGPRVVYDRFAVLAGLPDETIFYDDFDRTVSPGWGTPTLGGGAWSNSGSKWSASGDGQMVAPAGFTGTESSVSTLTPVDGEKGPWELTYRWMFQEAWVGNLNRLNVFVSNLGLRLENGTSNRVTFDGIGNAPAAIVWPDGFPDYGNWWWLKARYENGIVRVKAWKDGNAEPGTWIAQAVVAPFALSSLTAQFQHFSSVENTFRLDNFQLTRLTDGCATANPGVFSRLQVPRPRTMSRLGRPPVEVEVETRIEDRVRVTLAPSRRGEPRSRLRPPVVVATVERGEDVLRVTLAPSRRGRPLSRLRPPAVVRPFVAPRSRVTLTRIRPARTVYRLNPPTVTFPFQARPTAVTLAPQRRGRPTSFLTPPAVVAIPRAEFEVRVTLARIRPVPVTRLLIPPAVINTDRYFGPTVTLVRIRPPRTRWLVKPPTDVIPICFGTVDGFDFAPTVCGDDTAPTVSGSIAVTHTVAGSDDAATVEGTTASGGTVSGGDERREGC